MVVTKRIRNGLAVAVAVSALAGAPGAHAEVGCGQRVVADWAAGRLGPGYPVSCYQAALARLPEDVRTYSSAEDDIRRAMLGAVQARANQAAASPKREKAVRRPAVVRREAPLLRRPDAGAPTAQSLLPPPPDAGGGRRSRALLAVLVPGVLVLCLAGMWVWLARRGKRA